MSREKSADQDEPDLNTTLDKVIDENPEIRRMSARGGRGGGSGRWSRGRGRRDERRRSYSRDIDRGFRSRRSRRSEERDFGRRRERRRDVGGRGRPNLSTQRGRDRDYGVGGGVSDPFQEDARRRARTNKRFTTSRGLQVTVGNICMHQVRISGLHENVLGDDLRDIFSKYGPVNHCYIIYRDNGDHSGVGVATFSKPENAEQAAEDLEGACIDGVSVRVHYLGDTGNKHKRITTKNFRENKDRFPAAEPKKYQPSALQRDVVKREPRDADEFAPEDPSNPLER